jgi:4-amino-4-deoxy-L-arabinose transferase-like glycosyltransferase
MQSSPVPSTTSEIGRGVLGEQGTKSIPIKRASLIGIAVLGLALRCIALATMGGHEFGGDERHYSELAKELVNSGGRYRISQNLAAAIQSQRIFVFGLGTRTGDPTALRSPVYPWFVAAHYLLLGENKWPVLMTQAILDTMTCLNIYFLTLIVFRRETFAFLSGLTWAVWYRAICYTTILYTEILCDFLIVLGALLLVMALRKPSFGRLVFSGLVIGLAILMRSYYLLIYPLWFPAIVLSLRTHPRRLFMAITHLLCTGLILAVWVARNYLMLGVPLLSTQTDPIWIANNPSARGSVNQALLNMDHPETRRLFQKYPQLNTAGELEASRIFMEAGRGYLFDLLRNDPKHFAWLLERKVAIAFMPFDTTVRTIYLNLPYLIVLPLSGCGLLRLLLHRQWIRFLFLSAPVVSLMVTTMLASGHPRYRFGIDPFLVILAFGACLSFSQRPSVGKADRLCPNGET